MKKFVLIKDGRYLSNIHPELDLNGKAKKKVPIYKDTLQEAIRFYNTRNQELARQSVLELAKKIKADVVEIEEFTYQFQLLGSARSFTTTKCASMCIEAVEKELELYYNKSVVWIKIIE